MYAREICTSLEKPLGDIVLNYGALLLTSVQLVFAADPLQNKSRERAGGGNNPFRFHIYKYLCRAGEGRVNLWTGLVLPFKKRL